MQVSRNIERVLSAFMNAADATRCKDWNARKLRAYHRRCHCCRASTASRYTRSHVCAGQFGHVCGLAKCHQLIV